MRASTYSGQFRRDVALAKRRGKDLAKLRHVLQLLIDGSPLPPRLRDHPLKGEWRGWRDLHIEPDWLLVYTASATKIRFERTGTHADLFDE
ncbi:MAG: type II toxin-antitoxin system YafQ family toxin [Candidatus Eremiobacteraeota bacterium]|nr:type II toxin-antitoxin system YafQ family toxin [Candidatus Eremiobacteraeota bacterium]MBC5804570.1 type II toxin-antitoxin system YafQ family toxin [Candidatus Eremiobacteraeota bacterium]MBC5822782.1 type II toxin-antitoxin system YafQ family toxin [Candidatus Eremiobacteraeota bacterium]